MIIPSSLALSCLPSVMKQKHDFFCFVRCIMKQLLDLFFCGIQNNQGLAKGCQPRPLGSADKPLPWPCVFWMSQRPHPVIVVYWPSKTLCSIRLPNFFLNKSLLSIGDYRNSVAFFFGRIQLWTLIEWVVFSDCSRFWNPPQWQSKNSATPPTQQIFLPGATRVILPTTKGYSGERACEQGWNKKIKIYLKNRKQHFFFLIQTTGTCLF